MRPLSDKITISWFQALSLSFSLCLTALATVTNTSDLILNVEIKTPVDFIVVRL